MRGTSRFPLVLFLLTGLCLAASRFPAAAATYADPAAAWDRAGLRAAPPTPVQTLSVRDFGAAGDGLTDDTAAFESAIAALANPGVVSVPAGTYRITRSLALKSGLVLRGAGATASKLVFNLGGASDPCLDFTTYNSRSWVSLSKDAALGDTAVTVAGADGGETIHFKYAANCWVRRVDSRHTVAAHVSIESSAAIEVTDATFKYAHDYGDGGRGYGVSLGRHTSDCLVQNNVFVSLRHAMVVSQGANGNVFGYNFSTIRKCESTAWTPCDLSVHGHYPFRNLFEGNMVEEVDDTDYWGPAGPGNVFLRNVVSREGIEVMDASHGQAVLGNLLLAGGPLRVDAGITGTVLSGNIVTDATDASPAIAQSDAPASLYLAAAPSFFAAAGWPMLSGGADVNPAGLRYQAAATVSTTTSANPAMSHILFTLLGQ